MQFFLIINYTIVNTFYLEILILLIVHICINTYISYLYYDACVQILQIRGYLFSVFILGILFVVIILFIYNINYKILSLNTLTH